MFFYQISGHADPKVAAAVIVTDGFTMRWVHGVGLIRIKGAYKYNTGKDPYIVGVKDLTGIALQWVGPLPTPDYPIPSGVKVVTA